MEKDSVCLPDYKGGSIVNLMSSIAKACHGKNPYAPLRNLDPKEIACYKNIILVVLDGLGYEYLKSKQNSFLARNIRSSMTSVFLSTTASAITTFLTGVAPQQHAITGWHINLKELGMVTMVLPFVPRAKGSINLDKINVADILNEKGFAERIKRKEYELLPREIEATSFTQTTSKKSKITGFRNLKQMSNSIIQLANKNEKKFIYAYWPEFDSLAHEFGIESMKADRHLKKLDRIFKKMNEKLKGSNTIMIITADHGLISLPPHERILLNSHPQLEECLTLPMCGEPRVKYCYVRPSKTRQFEDYIKNNLSKYCWLFKSEDLIKRNFFGLGKPNPSLSNRVGDYVIIMKKNYIIKDSILGETDSKHVGNHGGVSKEEMLVPLIVLKP